MKFNIPSTIRVSCFTYKVEYDDTLYDRANLYGRGDHRNLVILIDPSTPEPQLKDTFVHEVLHSIDKLYDLGLTESQIMRLSHGVSDMIGQL